MANVRYDEAFDRIVEDRVRGLDHARAEEGEEDGESYGFKTGSPWYSDTCITSPSVSISISETGFWPSVRSLNQSRNVASDQQNAASTFAAIWQAQIPHKATTEAADLCSNSHCPAYSTPLYYICALHQIGSHRHRWWKDGAL